MLWLHCINGNRLEIARKQGTFKTHCGFWDLFVKDDSGRYVLSVIGQELSRVFAEFPIGPPFVQAVKWKRVMRQVSTLANGNL